MSWGASVRNAVGLGLGGIPSVLNAPPYAALKLNFAELGELDSRVTFSRGTNATLFDSNGDLQYAPHNLLTYSEQFDNAVWTKSSTTISANIVVAPDGTQTADKVVENTATDFHVVAAYAGSFTPGMVGTSSCYLKAGERSVVRIQTDAAAGFGYADFDLLTGAVTNIIGICSSATATPLDNGWYRCSIVCTATGTGALGLKIIIGSASYTGDGTSGIYVWGAQLNVGALQPYYSTTVKNLFGYSQEFDNAAWTKVGVTATANSIAAPDGSPTADKLVEDVSTGPHYLFPAFSDLLAVGQIVTLSVYAKAAEQAFLQLILTGVGPGSSNLIAGFDLATGIAGTPSAGTTSSILSVGNGWYRCRFTITVSTSVTATRQLRISQNASSTPSSYTGDGISGIYIWGAQFSDSASLDPYVYNPGAAPSAAAYYGPRFDHNPTTLAPLGLLIEEQRINSLRNNMMVGAVAGSPGTLPTGYGGTTTGGVVTRTIVGTGVENGITYIDVRFQTTGANNASIRFENGNVIAASPAQVWASAVYVKLVAGSLSNVSEARNIIFEYDAAGGFLVSNYLIFTPTSAPLSQQRYLHTKTMANALTTFVLSGVSVNFTGAGDATIRIGMPQLELGAFSTSVIPTTTTALTRAADVFEMTGANFSNWFNPIEGTVYTESSTLPNVTVAALTHAISDNTFNNSIYGNFSAGNTYRGANVVVGGVGQANSINSFTGLVSTNNTKDAFTYKLNSFAESCNGVTARTDVLGTVPVVDRLYIGTNWSGSGNFLNGHIRSFAYYPSRLRDSALQLLTN